MAEQVEKLLLKVSDVIKATGYCRSVVYSLIASGDLPSIRYGRSVRVPALALQQWIDRQLNEKIRMRDS